MRAGDTVTLFPDDPLQAQRVEVLAVLGEGKVSVRTGLGAPLKVDRSLLGVGASAAMHRTSDPRTSVDAARSVRITAGRWLVLDALANAGDKGLTDFEHLDRTGLKQTSAGKRRVELERAGLCEPAGFDRPSDTQSNAGVHRITAEGLRVWQAEKIARAS